MKRIVIHHNDADGKCCAAIIHFRFNNDIENAVFQPMDYTDRLDKGLIASVLEGEEWCEIWIVDFSLKPEDMAWCLELVDGRGVVYWFDHHKTAIESMPEGIREQVAGVQADGEAACLLVWRWLFPERRAPQAVEYIADRDVWRFDYGAATRGFYENYRLEENTAPTSSWWALVFSFTRQESRNNAEAGYRLYEARMRGLRSLALSIGHEINVWASPGGLEAAQFEEGVPCPPDLRMEKRSCLRVNAPASGDLGQAIKELGYDVAWCWTAMERDGEFIVRNSLYSDVEDVGAIAKANGGGGHKGAAGWVDRLCDMGTVWRLCCAVLSGGQVDHAAPGL